MQGKLKILLQVCLLLGCSLLLASVIFVGTGQPPAVQAQAVSNPSSIILTDMDNDTCLACHSNETQTTQIGSDTLSVFIDPALFGESVHGLSKNASNCTSCHPDITDFPHPEQNALSAKAYSRKASQVCQNCHEEQFSEVKDSIHQQAGDQGNDVAPTCTDCHNPHTQTRLRDELGKSLPEERINIPGTCAKCHNEIFNVYKESVHGAGVLNDNNPDTPTCTDCHKVHNIKAVDNAFRLRSPELCSSCHTNADMMKKYELSTAVMSTYVSDFHGTTTTIFEKTAPDQLTNKPVCIDCHGVHDIARGDDPAKGLKVKENLISSCQKCHPDAGENFSASWMSHYIASPTKAPLVYYVTLFYKILIPVVIGGMALYVLSDIVRRMIDKRKGVKHS